MMDWRPWRTALWLAAAAALGSGIEAQPPPAGVTAETQTFGGVHALSFRLPAGTIRAIFPDDLAAGDTVSGTVLSDPAGATEQERQSNSGELHGYVVDIEQSQTPVADKKFRWVAGLSAGRAVVILRNLKGTPVAQGSIPVGVPVSGSAGGSAFDLPASGTAGGMTSARGPFDGDFGTTTVSVGGAIATVLAESPRKITFEPPVGHPGLSMLVIKKRDLTTTTPFRTIGLLVSATNLHPLKGQTAILTVTVQGLQDLSEPADLILFDNSPGVVKIQGGASQHFVINPGQVRPDGTYTLARTLTGISAGDFNITTAAGLPPTLQFNLTRAVDHAVLDWQKSTGVPITAEAQRLISDSVTKYRRPLDEFLRAQEAYWGVPASITDALVRNYCFDLRDRRAHGAAGLTRELMDTMAFLPPPPKLGLDAQDVNEFSFTRFLSQLMGRLSPNQPIGYLMVSSKPDQSPISVDNHSGPDRTNRKFLVSAGTHSVLVNTPSGACRKSIQVQAFQTGLVACP